MTTVHEHRPGSPSWLDLMTPDLDAARAFYAGIFDWSFEVGPPETGGYTMCKSKGRPAAGMGKQPPGAPFPPMWNVYFATADVEQTGARIKELGGQVVMGPMDVMQEGRLAFCADPTGAHFGLWQPLKHKGAGVADEPGSMCWHEVNTRDAARATKFYCALFGLEARKMEGMDYWTLHYPGEEKAVCGVMQMGEQFPADVPPHWLGYFAVANADASVKKIQATGGKSLMPAFDTPYGRIAVVADPAGAVFSLLQPPG